MSRKKTEGEGNKCVLTLPLITEKYQEDILEKRFKIMEHLVNSLIAMELRKLKNFQRRKDYKDLEQRIREASEKEKKSLYRQRSKMIKEAGFSEYAFKDDMTPMQKHFSEHIATQVAHKTASDVWRAFEKYFYGGGKDIHFKQSGSLRSIANQTVGNGMNFVDGVFIWSGGRSKNSIKLRIPVASRNTDYEKLMLCKKINNLRVVRKWMKTRYKYYLQFNLEGSAVKKVRDVGKGRVGIDMGTQSIAIASEKAVHLWELADNVNDNHEKILVLQRKMDNSRRAMNPENYNPDGTIVRGKKLQWKVSNHYKKTAGKVRELQRKNADIRKYQHICLANYILSLGDDVVIEPMNYHGLQRRAKETKKDSKGRFIRKKRFGKSLANKAPAMFVSILEQKLNQYGGELEKVDIFSYKASQYDHLSKKYVKKKLSQRRQVLKNGDVLQRDLYSAFLLMNADETLKKPSDKLCDINYSGFKQLHDEEMMRLQDSQARKLSSFG